MVKDKRRKSSDDSRGIAGKTNFLPPHSFLYALLVAKHVFFRIRERMDLANPRCQKFIEPNEKWACVFWIIPPPHVHSE